MTGNLEEDLNRLKKLVGDSFDFKIRRFLIGESDIPAAAVFMSGLVGADSVERLIADLAVEAFKINAYQSKLSPQEAKNQAIKRLFRNHYLSTTTEVDKIFQDMFLGNTIILIDSVAQAVVCDTKDLPIRGVSEPEAEVVIRGPRDGFVESIETNTSLIRWRIRSPNLWMEKLEIGEITHTPVVIAYLKGLAQEGLVQEVRTRLKKINIDGILESGYIEELIADTNVTLFPLTRRTERTDVVTAGLLEGKVAIFTHGTPFVLLVPTRYVDLLQAPDDFYEAFPLASFLRLLRHLSFLLSIFLPGMYIAVINFHPELVPTSLMFRIAAGRQGIPFPAAAEVFMMEFLFELLREAGLRLPRMIGPAISIVGALILGDAAIRAGLVSPAVVVLVALTALASFAAPAFSLSITGRLIRFVVIIMGATFGLFGVQFGFILISIHLCALRSFGYPYYAPLGPLIKEDLKDVFTRVPWGLVTSRPKLQAGRNPRRQALARTKLGYPPSEEDIKDGEKNHSKRKGKGAARGKNR